MNNIYAYMIYTSYNEKNELCVSTGKTIHLLLLLYHITISQ